MTARIAFAIRILLAGAVFGPAPAQQFVISTYAGGAPPPAPVAALNMSIGLPLGVTTDAAGNVYFTSTLQCVFKVDSDGNLTRVAGNSRPGYSGDGGPAVDAQIFIPTNDEYSIPNGPAVDSLGNLYIAGGHRVRRISPGGVITTVAGNGTPGYSGDGESAAAALLNFPTAVAIDHEDNIYVADTGNARIRKISTDGIISAVPGAAPIYADSLAVDSSGNLYFVSSGGGPVIRKLSPSGTITTVAGFASGFVPNGDYGDGGPAIDAHFEVVSGLAVDRDGNIYVLDAGNSRLRKVSTDGIITTIAGNGQYGYSGDGGPATSAQISRNWIQAGLAVDPAGNLYFGDGYRIRRVSADGIITTVAGNGIYRYFGDGESATRASLSYPTGVAADGSGNLYILDAGNARVRKIGADGVITTVAGNGTVGHSGDGGLATNAQIGDDVLAADRLGNLYIGENLNTGETYVRRVSADGIITTVAGTGSPSSSSRLWGLAVDGGGNVYTSTWGQYNVAMQRTEANFLVHKLSPNGVVTTVAGSGTPGYSGDGGPATKAQLGGPTALAIDTSGNLYIADPMNHRVRKVSPAGIITTLAGNGGTGFSGDGGPATGAQLSNPSSVAVDGAGNLFIADSIDLRVRMVSPAGIITTVAGDGNLGYTGDGGPATSAQFGCWCGLAADRSGNIYLADQYFDAVRLLQPARLEKVE